MDTVQDLFQQWRSTKIVYTFMVLFSLSLLLHRIDFQSSSRTASSTVSYIEHKAAQNVYPRDSSPSTRSERNDAHKVLVESLNLLRDVLADVASNGLCHYCRDEGFANWV